MTDKEAIGLASNDVLSAPAGRKCSDCKFCIEEDYDYSNYTVEGTEADCLLGLNPDLPKDRWYGEEVALRFAEKCPQFAEGEPVSVDCDREEGALENYSKDPEIKALLRARDGR